MKTVTSSADLNSLASDCMSLVGDLINAQKQLNAVHERIAELGINAKMGDQETELAYLRRIAVLATEAEHDALKNEAVEDVRKETQDTVEFSVRRRPRSFLGRTFTKLARAIG